MTFDNNNSLKPTRKEEGVTQSGLIEKKLKDVEDQIDDIKERLTPLENTVEGFENEVNTDSVVAAEVNSDHVYTDALSVSGDADVQGTISAAKVTAADVEVSNKVKTKDAQVTNDLTVEGTGTFAQVSAENFDIETFNADDLNAAEFSSDNADITNLASDSITSDAATIKSVTSDSVTSENITVTDTITGKDAALSGDLSADDVTASNVKVSDTADVLKLIAETMQSGRLFIAPEQMFLIPENGWIHFHNVNAGRFILYLTDFTDITTNIHSLGNVKFSAVIDYVNNSEKGAVKVLYVQPELKSFEAVYIADNGEIWFKRSPQYLNARRAVVFAESEKELVVDTFAENAQTFNVSEAKSITLRNFNNDDEIVKEKFLKGDYTIDGNVRITGFLTPGQVISERALFLGYSDYVTADSDGILSAKGAVIDGNLSVVNDATINGDNTVAGDETIGGTLSVTGNTDLDADLNVDGETTLNDDVTVTGNVSVTGTLGVTDDVTIGGELAVTGDVTVTGDTAITGDETVNGILTVNGDIIQNGAAYETHAEKIYTKKDMIITRDGAISALPNGELSGITAKHYDSDGNDGVLGFDNTGTARVGDKGTHTVIVYSSDGITFYEDAEMTISATIPSGVTPTATGETNQYSYETDYDTTQPLLTRDEEANLSNGDVLTWDGSNKKAVGSNAFQKKNLANAIEGATTVEGALSALSTNKASKVSSATAGDIASLDANGNLVDSGVVASNVIRRVNPSTAVDCNDLTDLFTEYRVGDGDANRPTTGSEAYIIRTFKTGADSSVYSQIAYQIAGTTIYIRRRFSDANWSSWEKLITESDLAVETTSITGLGKEWFFSKSGKVVTLYTYNDIPSGQSINVGDNSVGTVPVGFRPKYRVVTLCANGGNSKYWLTISSNGDMSIYSDTAYSGPKNCGFCITYVVD